jgi:UDP:flavonoid glycosyltransferase YjiC (YdhE family)
MKFLFIVQGEGRGHLTQALTLEEHLLREGHEVVEVLVGKSRNRELPTFFRQKLKAPLSRFESPNFLPTPANRKNNLTGSILYNIVRLPATK